MSERVWGTPKMKGGRGSGSGTHRGPTLQASDNPSHGPHQTHPTIPKGTRAKISHHIFTLAAWTPTPYILMYTGLDCPPSWLQGSSDDPAPVPPVFYAPCAVCAADRLASMGGDAG